jgi:capsular exopolysaccharide synthesis family protein
MKERMYLSAPPRYRPAFSTFELADRFVPGDFRLTVGQDGRGYTLASGEGAFIEGGTLGDSIGTDVGFRWAPRPGSFPSKAKVDFSLLPPRDASTQLSNRVQTRMDRDGNFIGLSLRGTDPQKIASVLNAIMDRHVAIAADLSRSKLDAVLETLQQQLTHAQNELESAEEDLETFRVRTITLPSDNATPIAPGLEETRDPVFGNFFRMKVELEQVARDRARLQSIADTLAQGDLRVEALEGIAVTSSSLELSRVLGELVDARASLRTLRDRYADDYPPIQDQLTRIHTIENEAVPRVLSSILTELATRQRDLAARVESASSELSAIPPRTIEEARLRRRVSIQEALYNELRQRLETASLAASSSIPDVSILDRAAVPHRPSDDSRLPLAAMSILGALAAAVILAIILDRADPRFQYPTQVGREIGLDILGSIPRIANHDRAASEDNAAHVLEAFRELRLTIGFAFGSAGPLTLAVTSPAQGEGKSLISTNLAVAYAEMGRRTLLIDGDTRRGDAHRLLARERAPGLTDYLRGGSQLDIIQHTEYERLHFIGSGTRSGTTPELLASSRMSAFLGNLKRSYDVIIVDTPPLAAGGDAVLLGALTGNLALIIRTGSTDKLLTMAKLEPLMRLPIRILGAILNDVEPKGSSYRYYSSYLPGYEPGHEEEELDERPRGRTPLLAEAEAGETAQAP